VVVFALTVAMTVAVAGTTLGYDFAAYHAAADRVLHGKPLYDMAYQEAGPYGLFIYPPTFLPLVLVFGLVPLAPATWLWIAGLVAVFLGGVAALPVRRGTRWAILLLAGLSWPFLYALKLGQVGPILFALFALGWRWLDRGPALGATGALGAAIKIQPGLVLAWALLTRRWTAVLTGSLVLVVLAVVATLLAGAGSWADFLTLMGRINDPITTPHNFTPGAVLYQAGVPRDVAAVVQWVSTAVVAGLFVWAALRLPAVPSYLVAVIASQLVSPVLWDHYAVILLLPVAWLLDRGHWWAALVILATPVFLVGLVPAWVYPLAFWACLASVIWVGHATGTGRSAAASGATAPAGG